MLWPHSHRQHTLSLCQKVQIPRRLPTLFSLPLSRLYLRHGTSPSCLFHNVALQPKLWHGMHLRHHFACLCRSHVSLEPVVLSDVPLYCIKYSRKLLEARTLSAVMLLECVKVSASMLNHTCKVYKSGPADNSLPEQT